MLLNFKLGNTGKKDDLTFKFIRKNNFLELELKLLENILVEPLQKYLTI